ncbi:hypothetical protein H072_5222 [Dactylellina haptotyla CBS 200.50]|uniref:DUF7029 domain-containing protein n=1 Tax=Dactylellina haptotyla (strain CBS 200.50) TaxID=1284197 RepID=S8BN75_DACHA|nr:hypothetical protein H072_5222 [Dactylellina haptotyla CBS 200.50]
MVAVKLAALAVSAGLFGLHAQATPVRNANRVPAMGPPTIDDLAAELAPRVVRKHVQLLPIRERQLYPHLQKRDYDLSRFHLQDDVVMFYGAPTADSQIHLANVTLSKPHDDHPLLLLEEFDHFTKEIRCSGDKIHLRFHSLSDMNYAVGKWEWINKRDMDYFHLITHHTHKGCGADQDRTAYKIVSVNCDESALTTKLTRIHSPWAEAAQTFHLQVATVDHPAPQEHTSSKIEEHRDVYKRNNVYKRTTGRIIGEFIWCTIKPSDSICDGKGVVNIAAGIILDVANNSVMQKLAAKLGEKVISDSDGWSFSWGDKSKETEMLHLLGSFADLDLSAKAVCIGCYVDAKPKFKADIKRVKGDIANIIINFQPNIAARLDYGIQGTFAMSMDLNGLAMAADALLESIGVGEFVEFLPDISSGPGIMFEATSRVDIDTGFEISTGEASVTLDINEKTTVKGEQWDGMTFKPILNLSKLTGTFGFTPYFRFGLGLGVQMLEGVFKVGAFAGMDAKWAASGVRGYDNSSPCGLKTGLAEKSEVTVDIMWKISTDPVSGMLLDKLLSVFGKEDAERDGTFSNLYEKQLIKECAKGRAPLKIADRPTEPTFTQVMKLKMDAAESVPKNLTGYTWENAVCPDGTYVKMPFSPKGVPEPGYCP